MVTCALLAAHIAMAQPGMSDEGYASLLEQVDHEINRLRVVGENVDYPWTAFEAVCNDIQGLVDRVGVLMAGTAVDESPGGSAKEAVSIPDQGARDGVNNAGTAHAGSSPDPQNMVLLLPVAAGSDDTCGKQCVEEILCEISATLGKMVWPISQATTTGAQPEGKAGQNRKIASEDITTAASHLGVQHRVKQRKLRLKAGSLDSNECSKGSVMIGPTLGRQAEEMSETSDDGSLLHIVTHEGPGAQIKVVVQSASGKLFICLPFRGSVFVLGRSTLLLDAALARTPTM